MWRKLQIVFFLMFLKFQRLSVQSVYNKREKNRKIRAKLFCWVQNGISTYMY